MSHPAVTLEDVTITYGHHVAVHDVHAAFECGSLTAVAGPNGSGKSTLLKGIAGIIKPSKGKIKVDGGCARRIAYLPQTSGVNREFPITVLQAVATGLWRDAGEAAAIDDSKIMRVRAALAELDLAGFENRMISDLSGGQFQRVLFARTMLEDAQVILLDEPFAAVDADTTTRLIKIIMDWHDQGRTVICALHDLMLIKKYFPESVVLAGKCIGRGHTHEMFRQKLLSFDLDMAELYPEGEDAVHHHHHHHDHEH